VAGPIERAKSLLPQILNPRIFKQTYFYEGIYLIFWGLFLKMFVADNLATIVDPVFDSSPPYNGIKVLLSTYAFAIQIFCDFAGYSSIARGLGRVMGFDIMVNFNMPYFSTNPREFWGRWHISLSTWLRDYLYIPLGGNKNGGVLTCRNLAITMLLGGLWHGAAWTFVLWGAYQGVLLIFHRSVEPFISNSSNPIINSYSRLYRWVRVLIFFQFVCVGWLIFRAQSVTQAQMMFSSIFSNFVPERGIGLYGMTIHIIKYSSILFFVEFLQYLKGDLFVVFRFRPIFQTTFYLVLFYLIVLLGVMSSEEFIYFQF